jgi:hypothetical protein
MLSDVRRALCCKGRERRRHQKPSFTYPLHKAARL